MHDHPHDHTPLDPYTFGAEQTCFGCGPHNERGLKLRFAREGDSVVTRFTPTAGLDGPPGVLHGGLQAMVADEVAGWALVGLLGRMGFTTSMNVRYMRPLRLGREIEARAKLVKRAENIVVLRVSLSQDGRAGCRAQISYILPTEDGAERTLEQPLPEGWRPLFRDDG
ncbi:MAG: PaaI family thioesterase [Deltaproteobacteria bacterium]|nr:PaaI family thioesterase [Deltaproteobacteria bacterium]